MINAAKNLLWLLPRGASRALYRVLRPANFKELEALRDGHSSSGVSYKHAFERRAIFVHIPKAAGTAVAEALFGHPSGGHATLLDYRTMLSPQDFKAFYKFTFVRNPWDRLVSAYNFRRQGGFGGRYLEWANEHFAPYKDFSDFVERALTPGYVEASLHFKPQWRFLCRPFSLKPRVDFVGYYESLDADVAAVGQALGIEPRLKKSNVTVQREKDYRSAYTEKTRRIVAQVYAKDIEAFGYDFDGIRTRVTGAP